jgi:hypothetical protein
MKIALANQTIFGTRPITGWLVGDFESDSVKLTPPLAEGKPYLSIQPDGTYEGRSAVGGGYETFKKRGSDLVCNYTHDGAEYVHVVPFKEL